jgi:uncharacterized protein with PIN domain
MINSKLEYYKIKPRWRKDCEYCQKPSEDFYVVNSSNEKIFQFFNRSKLGTANQFYLCPQCFEKLHDLLEEIESENWVQLEDEYPDDDLSGENGSGR